MLVSTFANLIAPAAVVAKMRAERDFMAIKLCFVVGKNLEVILLAEVQSFSVLMSRLVGGRLSNLFNFAGHILCCNSCNTYSFDGYTFRSY